MGTYHDASSKLFEAAKRLIPGGVNSPVRAWRAVGGVPLFIASANGSKLWDADGNEYIDYVGSWGPMILGHAHPRVVDAIRRAAEKGTSYGAPTETEVEMAGLISEILPSIEMIRMVSSGTEACMSAIRLARAATGRKLVLKFEGCYHGHSDGLLVKAGSGATTLGVPDSPGVPPEIASLTLLAPYNDAGAAARIFEERGDEIACVIVEPIAGNMGVVAPEAGFLAELRALARRHGALLVFDEVISGFRVSLGGAQAILGIQPDLTCLGKIIGGGLPVGAYGGKREVMERVAPAGDVYQAGTLSGNPVAMAAGIETLRILRETDPYAALEAAGARLAEGIAAAALAAGVEVAINRAGSLLTVFFQKGPVRDYASALASDRTSFATFFHAMLDAGVYLPPSQFEALFLSAAHTGDDVQLTIEAARKAIRKVAEARAREGGGTG